MKRSNSTITPYLLGGLVLFGGMVGATAILLSGPGDEVGVTTESDAPSWKQSFDAVPERVEVAQDTAKPKVVQPEPKPEVKVEPVQLAIAHDDVEVDYGQQGRDLIDQGKLKDGLVALRKHLHTAEATPEMLLVVGQTARQVKQFRIAEAALEKGIELDSTRVALPVELARVHMDAERPKKAERAARRALRVDRDDATAWNQLGRAAMGQARWELAEIAFGRAVQLDPVDGLAFNNLGLLYIYMKEGQNAVDALERSVELLVDETPYFVFNNLGLAHELVNQNEEAREAFEEALLLNPFYTRAKVNLDRVTARIAAGDDDSAFETAAGVEVEGEPTSPANPDDA